LNLNQAHQAILNLPKVDAVEYRFSEYFKHARSIPELEEARKKGSELLSLIPSETLRRNYAETLGKEYNFKPSIAIQESSKLFEENFEGEVHHVKRVKLPKGVSREEFNMYGFYMLNDGDRTGIYFMNSNAKKAMAESNFTIRPLFHIYSQESDRNRRIYEINNGLEKRLMAPPSKTLIKLEAFKEVVFAEGNFLFEGTNVHLKKIVNYMSSRFPRATEIANPGWQKRSELFAFADGIFDGRKFKKADENGVVEHKNEFYFLPAFSRINELNAEDEDPHEIDKKLIYRPSDIDFETYAKQCFRVFGENGVFGIAWTVAACFRDFLWAENESFPLMFLQGQKETGKSQLAWALAGIWFHNHGPFNLNSGTDAGFAGRMETFSNCLSWMDEYTNNIDETRFQGLKGSFDGTGREKRQISSRKKNESDKVNNAVVISGQYLPTRDDNALFSRSILLKFANKHFTDQDKREFEKAKKMREKGLSTVLTDILKQREHIKAKYSERQSELSSQFRAEMEAEGLNYSERVMGNLITVYTVADLVSHELRLPIELTEFWQLCKQKVDEISSEIGSTDSLATFWKVFEFLHQVEAIKPETDYNWETVDQVKIQKGRTDFENIVFRDENGTPKPTRVLFFSLSKIHSMYLKEHRQQFNEVGLRQNDLTNYFKNNDAFVGSVKNHNFGSYRSTAWAFKLDELPLNLGQHTPAEGSEPQNSEQNNQPEQMSSFSDDELAEMNDYQTKY
jgi:hypothetical protein